MKTRQLTRSLARRGLDANMMGICRLENGLFIVRVGLSQGVGHGQRRVVARIEMICNGSDGRLCCRRRMAVGALLRRQFFVPPRCPATSDSIRFKVYALIWFILSAAAGGIDHTRSSSESSMNRKDGIYGWQSETVNRRAGRSYRTISSKCFQLAAVGSIPKASKQIHVVHASPKGRES